MGGSDARALSRSLLDLCRMRKLTIATAESCTGGLVAGALTDIPGSSDVIDRGFVTYSNEAKRVMLGVKAATLETFGAVSKETATAMAIGALEKAGVKYSEIEPVFLAPADARAAFERGAVDAWVIWDPFQAAAEAATGARTVADGTGVVANYQFYFASKKFLQADAKIVELVLAQLSEVDDWAKSDIHAVAEQLAPNIGLSVPVVEVALKRQAYGIKPVTDAVIADQQQVADTFFALGLIPKQIKISDVAWRPGT